MLAVVGGVFADGDAVPDGDLLGADEHVLDEKSQDALTFGNLGAFGVVAELGEEALEVVGELEVGVPVGDRCVQSGELAAQVALTGAQIGHPGAELVEGDQLFLERFDHAGDRCGGLGQSQFEPAALPRGGIGGAGPLQPFVDLGPDQVRVGDHADDVVPDDGVEVVGADGLVGADPATLVAVVVRAQAPVVVDLLAGRCGGRGPVVAISAAHTGRQALKEEGILLLREAKRLLSASRWAARSKVAGVMSAGTGMVIHSSWGRSAALTARGCCGPPDGPGG